MASLAALQYLIPFVLQITVPYILKMFLRYLTYDTGIYLITLYFADDMMKMSVIDLGSLAAAYPDLTQEERQLLADIRRSK
jgi:hypothetical protein